MVSFFVAPTKSLAARRSAAAGVDSRAGTGGVAAQWCMVGICKCLLPLPYVVAA